MDYESIANCLLRYRNKEGIFYTWLPDLYFTSNQRNIRNDIDWVVNANAFFFYSLLDIKNRKLADYLCKITQKGQFGQGSIYYYSPTKLTRFNDFFREAELHCGVLGS